MSAAAPSFPFSDLLLFFRFFVALLAPSPVPPLFVGSAASPASPAGTAAWFPYGALVAAAVVVGGEMGGSGGQSTWLRGSYYNIKIKTVPVVAIPAGDVQAAPPEEPYPESFARYEANARVVLG